MRNLNLEAALADVEARYVAANPKSKARFEAATRDMPGGNTRTVLALRSVSRRPGRR